MSWQQADPLILWHENRLDEIALEVFDSQEVVISIYPNPSTGIFKIQTTENIERIEVFNLSGRIIKEMNPNSIEMDLSKLPSGCYFLKFTFSSGDMLTNRIVKE